jgi:hypothetical protein
MSGSPRDASAEEPRRKRPDSAALDLTAGGALGGLLGIFVGLSSSPVVSIVVTALVGVLATLFGLASDGPLRLSIESVRRIASFALVAAIATPIALATRTHGWLEPTIAARKTELQEMGYVNGSKEQLEILTLLRYGTSRSDSPLEGGAATRGVLYAATSGFCDDLARVDRDAVSDRLLMFEHAADSELRNIGQRIARLPPARQSAVLDAAPVYLCGSSR